eukprot:Opistho-2@89742
MAASTPAVEVFVSAGAEEAAWKDLFAVLTSYGGLRSTSISVISVDPSGKQHPAGLKKASPGGETPAVLSAEGSLVGLHATALFVASQSQKQLTGRNEADYALVSQWLSFAKIDVEGAVRSNDAKRVTGVLQTVNGALADHVYLLGNDATLADIAVYCALRATVAGLSPLRHGEFVHLLRWFDHVQHTVDAFRQGPPRVVVQRSNFYAGHPLFAVGHTDDQPSTSARKA